MNPFFETQEGSLRIVISEQFSFPEHLHTHTEFLYVLEGRTEVSILDKHYPLSQKDCFLIFPGQIHSYHSFEENKVMILIFDTSITGSLQHFLQNDLPGNPHVHAADVPPDVALALERLSRPDVMDNPSLGAAWIQVLLSLLLPKLALTKKDQSVNETLTYQLVQYMVEHFREPLTLDSLAKALHVNKYYLSHIFSEKLHISFPRYLNHLRADYAAELMLDTSKPLSFIWENAGFSSQRTFNRAFLEVKGVSPLAWRKGESMNQ